MLLYENETEETKTTFTQYLRSIFIMPRLMQMLCLTNLLSGMAFVSYCLYFTDFVGEAVFMGDSMVKVLPINRYAFISLFIFRCFRHCLIYRKFCALSSRRSVRMLGFGSLRALSCSIYSMAIENLINLVGSVCTIHAIIIFLRWPLNSLLEWNWSTWVAWQCLASACSYWPRSLRNWVFRSYLYRLVLFTQQWWRYHFYWWPNIMEVKR